MSSRFEILGFWIDSCGGRIFEGFYTEIPKNQCSASYFEYLWMVTNFLIQKPYTLFYLNNDIVLPLYGT